jgi:hypothetical protein
VPVIGTFAESKMNSKRYSGEANEEFRNGDRADRLPRPLQNHLEAVARVPALLLNCAVPDLSE